MGETEPKPHQVRVIEEAKELGERLAKLGDFLGSEVYFKLRERERWQLHRQHLHMTEYLLVLRERIAGFC